MKEQQSLYELSTEIVTAKREFRSSSYFLLIHSKIRYLCGNYEYLYDWVYIYVCVYTRKMFLSKVDCEIDTTRKNFCSS